MDPSLLEALGVNPSCSVKQLEDFHEEISVRWNNYAVRGVDKNIIDDLVKKYPPPGNCQSLNPPKLNGEIEICLTRDARKQDCFLIQLQNQVASVLSAIGLLLSDIIRNRDNTDPQRVLCTLADSGQILCNILHHLSNHRRFLVKPFLKEDKRKVANECPIDEYLFSKKLQESIQSDKTVIKAANELKLVSPHRTTWHQRPFSTFEPQPGPSNVQMRGSRTKNTGHLNYQRPQNNSRKKTTPREYNRISRRYQYQQRKNYNPRK